MEEKNKNLTDEQLSQQLRKSKGGKWGGMLLSLLGVVVVFAGIVQGGNLVLIIAGVVILALGQTAKGKSREQAGRRTFDAMAPDVVSTRTLPPTRGITSRCGTRRTSRPVTRWISLLPGRRCGPARMR